MTSLYRLSVVTLLALGLLVTSAQANQRPGAKRAKASGSMATSTKKIRAARTKAAPPVAEKQRIVKTRLAGTRPSKVRRVSERISIRKADTAVTNYLASALTDRGMKSKRVGVKAAREAIGRTWSITDTKILSNSDPREHPITGNATVVVQAERAQNGKGARIMRLKKKREFIVNIGADGKATVIGERSNATTVKFLRMINEKLAITRIAQDIVHSSGVRKAATALSVVALTLLAGHSGIAEIGAQLTQQIEFLGPAIVTAAAYSAKNGVSRRTQARLVAFERVTTTLDIDLKEGKSVTLEGAYQRYIGALKNVTVGTQVTSKVKAEPREDFVKALAVWEVTRNLVPVE